RRLSRPLRAILPILLAVLALLLLLVGVSSAAPADLPETIAFNQTIADIIAQVTTPTLTTQLMKNHGLNNVSVRAVWPVNPNACRFAGPAYTVRYLPLREDLQPEQYLDHPDNKMRPMIEAIPPGAVLVLDANQRCDVGMLGGNLVTRLQARGVAAAVTDGGMRDIPELQAMDFPV
ncbi:MAG: hypothetical protein GY778_14420, partial [bacterium]|nr:hypothetical protein [bacterium]